MYNIWGTVYSVYCTLYEILSIVYGVLYMGDCVHCIVYSICGTV